MMDGSSKACMDITDGILVDKKPTLNLHLSELKADAPLHILAFLNRD
jgi:hypothetical protein